jgi:hypothetical protein
MPWTAAGEVACAGALSGDLSRSPANIVVSPTSSAIAGAHSGELHAAQHRHRPSSDAVFVQAQLRYSRLFNQQNQEKHSITCSTLPPLTCTLINKSWLQLLTKPRNAPPATMAQVWQLLEDIRTGGITDFDQVQKQVDLMVGTASPDFITMHPDAFEKCKEKKCRSRGLMSRWSPPGRAWQSTSA